MPLSVAERGYFAAKKRTACIAEKQKRLGGYMHAGVFAAAENPIADDLPAIS